MGKTRKRQTMKKQILLSLLILVGVGCKAQKYDTIPILMLYSDTTFLKGTFIGIVIDSGYFGSKIRKEIGKGVNHSPYTFWQYGYEVRKDTTVEAHMETMVMEGMPTSVYVPEDNYSILLQRLDADKTPLQKTIVVWQTIKINYP